MHRILPRLHLLTATVLVALATAGCTEGPAPESSDAGGTPAASLLAPAGQAGDTASTGDADATGAGTLTCEVYCSETRLRTANARISWIGPGMFQGGPSPAASPTAEQLQTTVFKDGYDKDLYASFSTLGDGQGLSPQAASVLPEPQMRAYDLSILAVAQPTAGPGLLAASADDPAARTSVEVEGLEPGMRYTWRIVFSTADGQETSETVTCEAPVCPADLQEATP